MPLSKLEILVHGLADGAAFIVLLATVRDSLEHGEAGLLLVQASLALLVTLLSALVIIRRLKPEVPGLRSLELLFSVLVGALGAVATVLTLAFMASGAMYTGSSPDAGGMAVMTGLFLYYPAAGLLILPLAMKVSTLSPRLRRTLGWSVGVLVLLPFIVLTAARLSVAG